MTWSWRYEDANGNEVKPSGAPAETFTTQADAETWLGETWRELVEAGVDQVTLFDEEQPLYGPMSLHPES